MRSQTAPDAPPALPVRTIFQRRQEVGLEAPDIHWRKRLWAQLRLSDIAGGTKGYSPWPSMDEAHHSPASLVLVSGSERVGKSIGTAMEAMSWLFFSRLIWVTGHQYRDALKEYDLIVEACVNAGLAKKGDWSRSEHTPSTLRTPYATVQTRSLYDLNRALVAEAPDLILVVEAGKLPEDPLDKLRLRLATRRGRAFISGTLEESAPWFEAALGRLQEWPNEELGFSISLPLWENTQDFPGGNENPEIETMRRTLKPTTFAHRVAGRPAPSELLVFAQTFQRGEDPIVAGTRLYRRGFPVRVCVDPGHFPSHYAVEFLQTIEGQHSVVDEVALQQTSHEGMILEAKRRPAYEDAVEIVFDPWAGNQHGMGYEKTPVEIWQEGTGLPVALPSPAPKPGQIVDRYWHYIFDAMVNGQPRFLYDINRCPLLDLEWRRWKHPKDNLGKPIKTELPKRYCDGIKAVGYGLVLYHQRHGFHGPSNRPKQPRSRAWTLH